ncbi:hypothetical protein GCM10022215_10500 [Nocardioides fonticola]|uniref:Uncharacterized protein n=1 Tax=Nocardioides fonticola TaxID=450363 RepID=A0ABP7XEJ3_9ACTN
MIWIVEPLRACRIAARIRSRIARRESRPPVGLLKVTPGLSEKRVGCGFAAARSTALTPAVAAGPEAEATGVADGRRSAGARTAPTRAEAKAERRCCTEWTPSVVRRAAVPGGGATADRGAPP